MNKKYYYFKHASMSYIIRLCGRVNYEHWNEEDNTWYDVGFLTLADHKQFKRITKEEAFIEML